jgi:hypothetical protein
MSGEAPVEMRLQKAVVEEYEKLGHNEFLSGYQAQGFFPDFSTVHGEKAKYAGKEKKWETTMCSYQMTNSFV